MKPYQIIALPTYLSGPQCLMCSKTGWCQVGQILICPSKISSAWVHYVFHMTREAHDCMINSQAMKYGEHSDGLTLVSVGIFYYTYFGRERVLVI